MKCSVVDKKPDGKMMLDVGKASFSTKAAAEAAMDAVPECKSKMQ